MRDLAYDRHIVLLGLMGAGKTTVGERLARRIGLPFVDVDHEIIRSYGAIADIFKREGEAGFRVREREAIAAIMARPSAVISPGGGAITEPLTRALLASGRRVYLEVPLETLVHRLEHSATIRPLVGVQPSLERVQTLYEARRAWYEEAEYRIIADAPVDIVVEMILAEFVSAGPVFE